MLRELQGAQLTLSDKVARISWTYVILILAVGLVGYAMLYSAGGASHAPWAWRHALRLGVGVSAMLVIALIDPRLWYRYAYVIYGLALASLLAVEVVGSLSKGAQRWIDFGVIQLQPSELMKIALVLALARYFHSATLNDVGRIFFLIPPVLLILLPAALVLKQPDLGTADMMMTGGAAILFLAGVHWWKFAAVAAAGAAAVPILWQQLHDYQRQRVLTFMNPETDPLGSGYHIIQSKIALGSGGIWGKGFLNGSQSQLSFLPEKQTDFIFTMLAEELGLFGGLGLLFLFVLIVFYGAVFALRARAQFARLLAAGVTVTLFLYIIINVAMVTGLIPVVGVPLPLVSYGGTAMMTVLLGCGLALGVEVHRDTPMPRHPGDSLL